MDELYEQARKEAERLRTVKQRTEDKLPKNEVCIILVKSDVLYINICFLHSLESY